MKRLALVLALMTLAGCATAGGGNSAPANSVPAETRDLRSGPPSMADELGKGGGGY
jgi:hypothetical protein